MCEVSAKELQSAVRRDSVLGGAALSIQADRAQGVYAKNTLLREAHKLFEGEVLGSGAPICLSYLQLKSKY